MSTLVAILAAGLMALSVFYLMNTMVLTIGHYFQLIEKEAEDANSQSEFFGNKVWEALARRLTRFISPVYRERIDKRIIMAGGLDGLTVERFTLGAISSSVISTFLMVVLVFITQWSWGFVAVAVLLGTFFPFIWLRDQVTKRHHAILSGLPYHLDLLTLCVEAGLDFSAGVSRMVEKGKKGPIVEEFQAYLSELRLGNTRSEALEAMSRRVGLIALSTFLSALIQADRMGTNLGKTLRIQSEQLRVERFQRAEKLANEAPVKMILPLVLFIFPTIWIILGGPLIFDWLFK